MEILVEKYLNKCNYNNLVNDFKDTLLSHPNYPSLLSNTDSLSHLDIENIAVNIPLKYLSELPNKFITELQNENSTEFFLIDKNESEIIVENNSAEKTKINYEELEKKWTGNCLIIEENPNQNKNIPSTFLKELYIFGSLSLISIISTYVNNFNFIQILQLIFSLIGIVISVEIVKTYFESNKEQKESKFCTLTKGFSCNSIINSNSKIFLKQLEFVDLPICFFSFAFLLNILNYPVSIIILLSFISFPLVIYSLYLQMFILKKWCLLCLIVAFLLIANTSFFFIYSKGLGFSLTSFTSAFVLFTLVCLYWFSFKNSSIKYIEVKKQVNSLIRFKRNEDVYNAISSEMKDFTNSINIPKITIGNQNTQNTITIFLSPSCPHCHTAYKDAKDLILKYPDKIKLEIAYNLNINNTENTYSDIAKVIMKLRNNKGNFIDALDDWHIRRLNIEEWKMKWFTKNDFLKESEEIDLQYRWCIKNEFNYAPVKIFNGKLLSQHYEINELFYFFKEVN